MDAHGPTVLFCLCLLFLHFCTNIESQIKKNILSYVFVAAFFAQSKIGVFF